MKNTSKREGNMLLTPGELRKMSVACNLLPEPGPEVVLALIKELQAIDNIIFNSGNIHLPRIELIKQLCAKDILLESYHINIKPGCVLPDELEWPMEPITPQPTLDKMEEWLKTNTSPFEYGWTLRSDGVVYKYTAKFPRLVE